MDKVNFWQLLCDRNRIEIPLIQRDYAQGRQDDRTREISKRFVGALVKAIKARLNDANSIPLLLDFIFGSNDTDIFVPFDGQQRLTTLWLLHLYAATRAGRLDKVAHTNLARFQYAVRGDTSLFCKALLDFMESMRNNIPNFSDSEKPLELKKVIQEQAWFLPQWKLDQTIDGMINMLDYIANQFHELPETWSILTETPTPPIQFYFKDIEELKISGDELFIKMNARGKQLTEYEIFKARFLEWLEKNVPDKKSSFTKYLNNDWQNLFWSVFGKTCKNKDKARYTDECFCRFLRWFSTMLLYYNTDLDYSLKDDSLYNLCINVLSNGASSPLSSGNLQFLENSLNALLNIEYSTMAIQGFFESIFYLADDHMMPSQGHISWFKNNHLNMFMEICAGSPTGQDSQMFFGILLILAKKEKITEKDLLNLRILRNLFANSSSEIYEAKFHTQLPALANLVLHNKLDLDCGYNGFQLKEEKVKIEVRTRSPKELCEKINWLEDHPLLRGCLAMFTKIPGARSEPNFEDKTLRSGQKFFEEALGTNPLPWDRVLKSLLSCGAFGLQDSTYLNKYIYLGADRDWDYLKKIKIFTTTRENSFPGIRESLQKLAQEIEPDWSSNSPAQIMESKANMWLEKKQELDWRWYFVKYSPMRPDSCGTYGRYDWGYSPRSFEQRELASKTLHGSHWNPFLWTVYVEAGLENAKNFKNKIEWVNSEETEDISQIIFNIEGSCLAIWPFEFFWWINTPSGREPRERQIKNLDKLRRMLAKQNITLTSDGSCYIPGQDSAAIDYKNFDWDKIQGIYRMYDTEDRIQIGIKIALALANL